VLQARKKGGEEGPYKKWGKIRERDLPAAGTSTAEPTVRLFIRRGRGVVVGGRNYSWETMQEEKNL